MSKENRVKIAERTDNPFLKFFGENFGILAALVVISIIVAILSPVFLSVDNALSVGRQISTNAVLTLGMALVIIIGGIDLSVGAVVALSGTLCVGFINKGTPVWFAVILCIAVGMFVGLINGVIIAKTGMAPFIVTMSTMNISRGVAYLYSGGLPLRCAKDEFAVLGTGYLGPVPLPIIYLLILILAIWLLLARAKFGAYVYAIGGNREAAKFSGISIVKVEVIVYTLSGLLSGFAGVVLASRMFSGQPSVQQGAELDAIAACVLGGVSMTGGMGKIGGTMIGALIIGVISNGLNLLNVNSFVSNIVKGVIVLIAVYIDIMKKKKLMKG